MAGGSQSAENPTDQQCQHCYLYFSPQGHSAHQPNCPFKDIDVSALAPGRDSADPPEGGGAQVVSTDGGAPGPREPPTPEPQEASDDQEEEVVLEDVDVDDDPDCPECGHPDWWPTEDIAEVLTEDQVSEFDYCCADCRELYS